MAGQTAVDRERLDSFHGTVWGKKSLKTAKMMHTFKDAGLKGLRT